MRSLMIAPSILSADFTRLGDEIRAEEEGVHRLDPGGDGLAGQLVDVRRGGVIAS